MCPYKKYLKENTMACFLVPLTEAIIVSAADKVLAKRNADDVLKTSKESKSIEVKVPLSRKIKWLKNMLFGGSALLAFEHVWHGEVTPFFPFLTAMADKGETVQMLREIATAGVSMALLVTAVWFVMCRAADYLVKKPAVKNTVSAKSAAI